MLNITVKIDTKDLARRHLIDLIMGKFGSKIILQEKEENKQNIYSKKYN